MLIEGDPLFRLQDTGTAVGERELQSSIAVGDERTMKQDPAFQVSRRLRVLLERLRDSVPSHRRAAVEAKLELVEAGARRSFCDEPDRLAAAVADPQCIGSSRRSLAAPAS
jgi:uncharacterized membrane protein